MKLESLQDLFVEELKDLYSAENQILKALPKMAKKATSKTLQAGFTKHLKQTEGHVNRLEKIFSDLGVSPGRKKCKAMEGLLEEGQEIMDEEMDPDVMDAALIAAAQRVEHYEIAGYGCVRTYANLLGNNKAATMLQLTLDEEGDTDKSLTKLSETINVEAEGDEDDEKSPSNGRSRKAASKNRAARRNGSKGVASRIREAVGL